MPRIAFRRKMSAADLNYLTVGRKHDVNISMVFLLVLDTELNPHEVREQLRRLTATVPRFRQRIVRQNPWTTNWSVSDDVRIDDHLTEITVADRGLDAAFAQLPSLLGRPFDAGKPPWQALYFRGMPDGRALLAIRLHHCMGDGLTYMAAFQQAFGSPQTELTAIEERHAGASHNLRVLANEVRTTAAAAGRAVRAALTRHGRTAQKNELQIWATPPPPGRIGHTRSGQQISMWTVPAETWARVAREHGGRRNALFLLITSYTESDYQGWPDEPAALIMPINLRPSPGTDIEQDGSINLASGVVILDRNDIRNGRLPRVDQAARNARDNAMQSSSRPVIPDLMQLLPATARRMLNLRLFARSDLVASNLGSGGRLHLGRAGVSIFTVVSPAVGCPVAFTAFTYDDEVVLVSSIDPGLVTNPSKLEAATPRSHSSSRRQSAASRPNRLQLQPLPFSWLCPRALAARPGMTSPSRTDHRGEVASPGLTASVDRPRGALLEDPPHPRRRRRIRLQPVFGIEPVGLLEQRGINLVVRRFRSRVRATGAVTGRDFHKRALR
ncbi:wax ester/triacylglycerol synthase domain-containing protein [Saccharopolyspora sp. NPDC050642]|uniref:wax ester/triacylglycerol synthase domain-containing protein n=1 Tax=Saccharopolyspora sp. NPDC050642 TaxID=3157099 RepID=UPI0033DDCF37